MAYEDSWHAVAEAEALIGEGEFSRALDKLETAAEALPRNEEDAAPLFARIRELLDTAVAGDPGIHEPQVWAIRALLPQHVAGATARGGDPWFYQLSTVISDIAILAAVLCVIGGVVVGIEASKYTDAYGGETRHQLGVVAVWVVSGMLAAALWLAIGAGLRVVVDNGRMLRRLTAQAQSSPHDG
jgi:hypothetical protein